MSAIVVSEATADAVRRCRAALTVWALLPVAERLRPVRALRRLLVREADRIATAVKADVGRSPAEVAATELLPTADACQFLERAAARLLKPTPAQHRPFWLWGQTDTIHRRPHGVVGIIGTWNYPVFLNVVQIMHALTAGNGVVWKPSELTPRTAEVLGQLVREAGFPADLLMVLPATREGGAELAESDIDHVVFTGSATVGRKLAQRLGERLISSTLELSGCDAQLVLADADVALAARAAWFGAMVNRGQTCIAVRRAIVDQRIYGPFLNTIRSLAATADPVRLALPSQVEQAERLVDEALAGGARLLQGRPRVTADERLCRPTIICDAQPEMALCQEASFAPLLAVLPFDSSESMMRLATACDYALGASIFTRDPVRAARLAAKLPTGFVTINDVIAPTAHPGTPFGGRKASGWGVTQGAEGLLAMTVPQVVSLRTDNRRLHYDMLTADTEKQAAIAESVRGLLEWSHGGRWSERWAGLRKLWNSGGRAFRS